MHCMVASSIPCKLSLCADRAHACAGDSYVSSAIDVACPTTQSVFAIASPHELHGDSWPSSSTGTRSFCCNHQYSITAVTTSTGSIAERYAYSAYGQPTILDASASVLSSSAINNRYAYTGREWDATLGLYHFRARWMSPVAGRFLSRDPIGYEDSVLMYGFLRNRSLDVVDPTGNCAEPCKCWSSIVTRGEVKRDFEIEATRGKGQIIGSAELKWFAEGSGQGNKCAFKRLVYGKQYGMFNGQPTWFPLNSPPDEDNWAPDGPRFGSTYRGQQNTTLLQIGNKWEFNDYDRPAGGALRENLPYYDARWFIQFVVNEDGTISSACCDISRLDIHIKKDGSVSGTFKNQGFWWLCTSIAKQIMQGGRSINSNRLLPPLDPPAGWMN